MTATSQTSTSLDPSPVERGARIADHWIIGARWATFGDVHFHGATSEIDVDVAVWRYQGSQPLPRFLEALEADRQRFTALVHPQVCRTFDVGRQEGGVTCYWVQESPGGVRLLEHLHDRSVIVPDLTVAMALQIALGLDAIHRAGLIHGDLDPEFVRVLGEDRVKLGWAGLAVRLEAAGLDTGRGSGRSMAEVAPETLRDGTTDARSDVYSFAALLYRMLAGVSPFLVRRNGPPPGIDPHEALERLPSGVPQALRPPLLASLGHDPTKRPTMAEWIEALRAAERQLGTAPARWTAEPVPRRDPTTPAPVHSVPSAKADDAASKGKLRIDSTIGNLPRSGRTSPGSRVDGNGQPPLPSIGHRGTVRPKVVASGSQPAPVLPVRARPSRGPSLATYLAATSLMALIVLGGVAIMVALGDPPPRAAEPVVPATPPALPAIVTIATYPPGATVLEGDEVLGATPLELVLDVQQTEIRDFSLELEGYAPHTLRQPWIEHDTMREIVLQPHESEQPGASGPTVHVPSFPPLPPPEPPLEVDESVADPRVTR